MATHTNENLDVVAPKKTVTKSVKKEMSDTSCACGPNCTCECCMTGTCSTGACSTNSCGTSACGTGSCTKLCTIIKKIMLVSILVCSAASVFMLCKIYNLEVLKAGGEDNFKAMQSIMEHPLYIEDKASYIQATQEQIEKAGQEPQVDAMQPEMQVPVSGATAPVSGATVQVAPVQPVQAAPAQPVAPVPTQPVVR